MMTLVASVLFILLANCNASKYFHPFQHFHHFKDLDPDSDVPDVNEGESEGMIAKLAAKLRSERDEDGWDSLPDPRMYVLQEQESPGGTSTSHLQEGFQDDFRTKRKGPSLSITNPLEVLQEKWLIEQSRRQKAASKGQIQKNRQFLMTIGKRNYLLHHFLPGGSLSNEHTFQSYST